MGEGEGWGGFGRGQAASTEMACAHVWVCVCVCAYVCRSGNMHVCFLRGGKLLAGTELWARLVRMQHHGVPAARRP